MKRLAQLIGIGLVLFLGMGMAQEWHGLWYGYDDESELPKDPELEKKLEQTVRQFLAIAGHFYQSGGDPRFAERLPASERVSAELAADGAYLRSNGRIQTLRLMKLEVLAVERVTEARATVRTVEYWVIVSRLAADPTKTDPVVSQKVHSEYRLERDSVEWKVSDWDLIDPPAPAETSHHDGQPADSDEAE